MNIKVSASILCADFACLKDEIKRCEDAGVDMIHVDVMDGHFVPNISIGQVIVEAIRPITKLPIETHLMIEHPGVYIHEFVDAGADIISIHAECYGVRRESCRNYGEFPKEIDHIDSELILKDIRAIKAKDKQVFIVINPGTPLMFDSIFDEIDGVLCMSVNPGFAKQSFIPQTVDKIRDLRSKFKGDISVDGGINATSAPIVVEAGANVLATASYLFGSQDMTASVNFLKELS